MQILIKTVRLFLFPLSIVYYFLIVIRNLLFDLNFINSYHPENKSIVVGNLKIGGTGKTPVAAYLLSLLKMHQINTAYISRGYKRKTKGYYVADNEIDYQNIGDEALQVASKFPETPVIVCEKRAIGIKRFVQENKFKGVFILDDAFQHRFVKAGVNILLTTYKNDYKNDFILPVGNLREPSFEAKRAQIIIVTKCPDTLSITEMNKITTHLKPDNKQYIFFSCIKYHSLYHAFSERTLSLENLKNFKIFGFSGIASPRHFFNYLKNSGHLEYSKSFKDHKSISITDFKQLIGRFHECTAADKIIVTTEKDFFRLKNLQTEKLFENLPLYILPISIEFLDNKKSEFDKIILEYVKQN